MSWFNERMSATGYFVVARCILLSPRLGSHNPMIVLKWTLQVGKWRVAQKNLKELHSRKQTCPLNRGHFKMNVLFQRLFSRRHVSSQEGIHLLSTVNSCIDWKITGALFQPNRKRHHIKKWFFASQKKQIRRMMQFKIPTTNGKNSLENRQRDPQKERNHPLTNHFQVRTVT